MTRLLGLVPVAAITVAAAAPSSEHPLPQIERGVKIGGIAVGGLNAEAARLHVSAVFDRSVRFTFGDKSWRASPQALGARPAIGRAVSSALQAPPRRGVPLRIGFDHKLLARYVSRLNSHLSRPAEDAQLVGLSHVRPVITPGRPGLAVNRPAMERSIVAAFAWPHRPAVPLVVEQVQPKVTSYNFGPVIVVETVSHKLLFYEGESLDNAFTVATGQASYPTPIGEWSIIRMDRNPWWIPPPNASWAQGAKPIPPGPGNPLGTRWMGLSAANVGIHGTPDAASLGYSESHGCIRMSIPDAEWVFDRVHVGTPVFTVAA